MTTIAELKAKHDLWTTAAQTHREAARHAYMDGDPDTAEWHLTQQRRCEHHASNIRREQHRMMDSPFTTLLDTANDTLQNMLIAENLGEASWDQQKGDWIVHHR